MMMKLVLLLYYIAAFPLGLVDAQARYEGSGNCSEPCVYLEEFCGSNNECIRYSCSNWYLFGPPEYTGHDGGTPIVVLPEGQDELYVPDLNFTASNEPASLECKADMNDERSTGIIYGCSRWSCTGDNCTGYDGPGSEETGIDQEFTRRCEAANGQNLYVCYDLVGATNLQSFEAAAENSDLNCTLNEIDNSTEPLYIYQVQLENPRNLNLQGGPTSATFNNSLVEIAMHSYIEEVDSTVNDGSTSGGNQLFVGKMGLWAVLATTMICAFFSECFL